FHELIVLQLLVLRRVGMADNDFINIGLWKALRLDFVLLRCAEQIVKKRDVQLEYFNEFNQAAIGDVELTVKVESTWIGFTAVFGDLPVVDVAGEFGRILILFIFRLKGAD